MDIKAVGNVQASIQTNAQSAEVTAKEVQKNVASQNNELQKQQQAAQKPSVEDINNAMKDIQEKLNSLNGELKITTDDDTGIQVIKIVERHTDKLIRQIPSEAVLKIARYLDEIAGLLYNEKV
ncbi:MAG TPA: flagellar protein FlaG [Chlorobaculum parvum]|uniref:Flagellar protein FlaG n=1 Tax=Chlorobaculum parvum TaxID=274539 RepID=A0A7C5DC28_9CHLB|nr:flagellar protein FlaG [Chlorobaculum parvum]